jgi:hypothetical protein
MYYEHYFCLTLIYCVQKFRYIHFIKLRNINEITGELYGFRDESIFTEGLRTLIKKIIYFTMLLKTNTFGVVNLGQKNFRQCALY